MGATSVKSLMATVNRTPAAMVGRWGLAVFLPDAPVEIVPQDFCGGWHEYGSGGLGLSQRKVVRRSIRKAARSCIRSSRDGQAKATLVRDLGSGKEHTLGRAIDRPRWSPDSQTIFGDYTSPDPNGDIWNRWNVAACPADGRPCRTLTRGFRAIPSGDGSRLFYVRDTGAARNMREVWTVSVDGSEPRKVGTMGPLPSEWDYDVSRTDQIVFTRLNASRRELWVAQLR